MVIPDKPIGGTELMLNELMNRLDSSILDNISIFNYIGNADFNKITIYWNQLSFDQDAVQFLKDEELKNKINYFVFVSHWQAELFRKIFNIPGYKTFVIKNAALEIADKKFEQSNSKLKICYTSTPWRGLHILLEAWRILNPEDCELHVFSSTKIYGKDFYSVADQQYQALYQKAEELPGVTLRGFVDNEQLRKELTEFDIMAYPCTFEETSCISVIEALSAGLKVVCSNIGALPETTEGWANMYTYKIDSNLHVEEFVSILSKTINDFRLGRYQQELTLQADIYKKKWSWSTRINEWVTLLNRVIKEQEFLKAQTSDQIQELQEYQDEEIDIPELGEGDIIIDIGAGYGNFSRKCLEKGVEHVICFEPLEKNRDRLKETLSNWSNVTIHEFAVWSKSGLNISFASKRDLNPQNSLLATTFTKNGDNRANTVSLDDTLNGFEKIRLLKIDAEGSEYPILFSSQKLQIVDEILVECHQINADNALEKPLSFSKEFNIQEMIKHLNNFGFDVEVKPRKWPQNLLLRAFKQPIA